MNKFIVTISPVGQTTISAFCLKTDLWQDYLHFLIDARQEHEMKKTRQENRYLRAALLSLFAHLEASVNDLIYKSELSNKGLDKSLNDKCVLVSEFAEIESPTLNEMKKIRNILVHPGGKEDDSIPFDTLSLDTIEAFGSHISDWLDEISGATCIPRFSDTKGFVENMSHNLGSNTDTNEI